MREPGNMSGVARVTFPNESGTFLVSYIRLGTHSFTVLGDISINVPHNIRDSVGNTYDTENYSPRFRNSLTKMHSITSLQESTKTGNFDNEHFSVRTRSIV